jgi:RNA polymerase sigma-70 factor (ECF subfamily)
MSEQASFADLIRRVRAGDQDAAGELVRRYEPAVRRVVHFRLVDPSLRRLLDSTDVCQSVLASFFVGAALGRFEVETPEQLLKLLAVMARNKLVHQVERQRAACRDYRRVVAGSVEEETVVAPGPGPDSLMAARELLEEARRRLSPDELELVELRNQGYDWAEIAARVGGRPVALRKKLSRAVARLSREMDLDGGDHA